MTATLRATAEPTPENDLPAPLGAEEFVALMQKFGLAAPPPDCAVAVSGGPDSMALALCAKRWSGNANVIAFIVDHALRPESAAEAASVKQSLAAAGIAAEILRWDHAPVTARLQENARNARYRLLIEACRARGIRHLLIAHQRDDQAETVLMRIAKGSGIDGLAGIPARKNIGGVRILRPFLAIPRERLAATCEAAGIPFVSDPSNHSPKFARGRLRRVMPLLAEEGLNVERLLDLAARAADAKDALDHAADALLRVATRLDEAGAIRVDLAHLRAAPRAIAGRAFGTCLQSIQPSGYAPEYAPLMHLLDALRGDQPITPSTLHGCLVARTESRASIMREYAAITDETPIRPGESVVWDNRWRVSLSPRAQENFIIRALGNPPHEALDRLAPGLRKKLPQGRARAVLPALWLNGSLAIIPASGGGAESVLAAPWPPRTAAE